MSPTFSGFPALSTLTFLPIFTISPVPSCPRATGINPNGSLLNSCASVPQTPQPSTLTRISPSPSSGIGNSLISKCSRDVSIATCAVFGIAWLAGAGALAAGAATGDFNIFSSTCFTTSSTFAEFISIVLPSILLSDTQAVCHNTSSSLSKCACACQSFSCTACDCESTESFTAKAKC